MRSSTAAPPLEFLTPAQLCSRWQVDIRTLNKFNLPWVRLSPQVRRVALHAVEHIEQAMGIVPTTDCSPANR